jgi:hypothetical protein
MALWGFEQRFRGTDPRVSPVTADEGGVNLNKTPLTLEHIESQSALELPEREQPQTVVVTCLAVCIGSIQVDVSNVHIAAAVCATVQALTALTGASVSCQVSA